MKHIALALSVITLLMATPVQAQNIALADADYLMNVSEAAKSIKGQLKSQREKFQSDFKSTQASLQKDEKALLEKRKNLTDEEFKKQISTFQSKMKSEESKFQKKKEGLDEGFSNALKDLQKEIGLVIQQVAKEKSLDLVISKQSILFAAAGQKDITEDVLTALNAKIKTIQVKTSQ